MRQEPTMQVVADAAGVSKATVSMVLRNRVGISEETRQRVLEVVRKMNYRPLPTRGADSRVSFGQVGLFVLSESAPRMNGEPGSSYLHNMLEGCVAEAEKHGRGVLPFRGTFEQVRSGKLPVALQRSHLDGLLFRGWLLPEVDRLLRELNLPVVLLDSDRTVPDWHQVQIDNIQAMRDLVKHLASRGARRLATITGDMEHVNAQERLAGLQMAVRAHGLALPEENIVAEHGFSEASGHRGTTRLLDCGCTFDTLVCQNDLVAVGASDVLRSKRLRVPDDVRLTGFDNMEFAEHLPIPLTTLDPESFRIGQGGMRMLNAMIEGADAEGMSLRVPVRLVAREST